MIQSRRKTTPNSTYSSFSCLSAAEKSSGWCPSSSICVDSGADACNFANANVSSAVSPCVRVRSRWTSFSSSKFELRSKRTIKKYQTRENGGEMVSDCAREEPEDQAQMPRDWAVYVLYPNLLTGAICRLPRQVNFEYWSHLHSSFCKRDSFLWLVLSSWWLLGVHPSRYLPSPLSDSRWSFSCYYLTLDVWIDEESIKREYMNAM